MAADIRAATPADVPAIVELRNHYVASSDAIWTLVPMTEAEGADWLAGAHADGAAFLVAVDGGSVLGYATYGPWRPQKEGYRLTVEDSVYLAPEAVGHGTGTALLAALIDHARAAGAHVMLADIESENAASIALHRRFGFEQQGRLGQIGTKFGRWLDLSILALRLTEDPPPA